MDYWLLLALVYTTGFAILLFQSTLRKYSEPILVAGAGFVLLAAYLGLELLMRFELQDWVARGFYWLRIMLVLAWLGHAALLLHWPQNRFLTWGTKALLISSLLAALLITIAPITRAEDWFNPSLPVYGQLGDLLATNRPIRWGALTLNLYGAGALIIGAVYGHLSASHRNMAEALRTLGVIVGALLLLLPIYAPPGEANAVFFFSEALAPFLLFFGLDTAERNAQGRG